MKELKSPLKSNNGFILQNDDFIKRPKSPTIASLSPSRKGSSPTSVATQLGVKISIQTMDNLMNNRNIMKIEQQKMNLKNNKRHSQLSDNDEDDKDNFSDDSLEDTSLPPPAPPPIVVPPPPSLSAPVTPSKRHSIAWEVNLDDLCSNGNGFSTKVEFFIFSYNYSPPFFAFSLSTLLRIILSTVIYLKNIFRLLGGVYAGNFRMELNFVY